MDPKPELFVPDLTPSPAAVVDSRGNVGCIECAARLPLGDAQVVGRGFRCRACADRAAIAGDDTAAHLDAADASRVRPETKLRVFVWVGLAMLAVAAVMWATGFDIASHGHYRSWSLFVTVFLAGTSCLGIAWFRWRDRCNGRG